MFDEKVVQCFLENQLQLYPEKVAETYEEDRKSTRLNSSHPH